MSKLYPDPGEAVYAVLAKWPGGEYGLCAFILPGIGTTQAICSTPGACRVFVERAKADGLDFKVVRYSQREDVTELFK